MGSTLKGGPIVISACCVAFSGVFLLYNLYTSQQRRKPHGIKAKCMKLEDLPTEVISEIISYLSVDDLLRCKSVWKQLNVDTESSDFAKKFKMHKTPSYFCNFCLRHFDLVINSKVTRTLATCDGLKLKRKYTKRNMVSRAAWKLSYYIKNPAMQNILNIPEPPSHNNEDDYAFSFVPSTGEYKAVVVYLENGKGKCAILTLGVDANENKWRVLDVPGVSDDSQVVVQAGAVVHCVRAFKDVYEILSLDLETECFSVTSVEKSCISTRKEDTKQWAISWNGALSFVHIEGDELKVSVLEDYKTQKWGNSFVVPLTFVTEKNYVNKEIIPLSAENGLIWFILGRIIRNGHLLGIDPLEFDIASGKIVRKLATKSSPTAYLCVRVFSLVPSYVVLKGMQPKVEKSVYSKLARPLLTGISKLPF